MTRHQIYYQLFNVLLEYDVEQIDIATTNKPTSGVCNNTMECIKLRNKEMSTPPIVSNWPSSFIRLLYSLDCINPDQSVSWLCRKLCRIDGLLEVDIIVDIRIMSQF